MTDTYVDLPYLHECKVTLTVKCPSPLPTLKLKFLGI